MKQPPHSKMFDGAFSIEHTIRAAGDFVRPSDDLRPRVIEAAKEHCGRQRAKQRTVLIVGACGLLALTTAPLLEMMVLRSRLNATPSSQELQQQAIRYSTDTNVGPHWGLTEAFKELRHTQARKLGVLRQAQ
jgi:hypothetical protein